MKKKILLSCIVLLLIAIVTAGYIFIYEYHYKIIWKHETERIEKFQSIESSYQKEPNMHDAIELLEYYLGEENYEKAFTYGQACIDLGFDDELTNGRINFFLARISYELNKIAIAREYLITSLKFGADKNLEKFSTAKKYGIHDLLTQEEWSEILKNPDPQGQALPGPTSESGSGHAN